MQGSNKALESFLAESGDNLEQLERDLVELEQQPDNQDRLASAFRAMHTIKGTCGFFGFPRLEALSHALEDVLVALRDGALRLDLNIASALLEGVDGVRRLLAHIAEHGNDGEADHRPLINRLQTLCADPLSSPVSPEPAVVAQAGPTTEVAAATETTIRVDIGLLDKLMNVMGELVLARNQLLQYAGSQNDSQLVNLSQRLNLVTSELQEGLMKTRMQPISHAWSSYPRLIRDLELQTGKKIRLDQQGGDTELDRSLLQAIRDPLIHLIRNAVDHGIETPSQRLQQGKPESGLIKLRAYHESGNVIIEITDDGGGIRRDAIIARARERNLLRAEEDEQLSERDVLGLMFLPGFSTAEQVTNISGRGVGLDVVRNNVERIGGSIDIQSEVGSGTSLKIKIPLTLAIIPALIVGCRHERFAVPQVNLLEVVHIAAERATNDIEQVHDALVYRLRGKLLPLVDLRTLLQMGNRQLGQSDLFILVLQADGQTFGLMVDSVRDTEEIVVKPLGKLLRETRCFAGATIMGDGRVALIIDVRATAEYSQLVEHERRSHLRTSSEASSDTASNRLETLLLIEMQGGRGRAAVPLSRVARLEEFAAERLELSAGREVVQYRDRILPVARLETLLGLPDQPHHGALQVVVQQSRHGDIGLVVGRIIDVVEDSLADIQYRDDAPGIIGSAIIQGHITDLIDTDNVVARYFATSAAQGRHAGEVGSE
jgi:two-component system, chemotaxis family, sensor kinase CheA